MRPYSRLPLLFLLLTILFSLPAHSDFPLKIAFAPRQQTVSAFPAAGKIHISHEMLVTNFSTKPVEITSLSVTAAGANSPFRTYTSPELSTIFSIVSANYNMPQQPLLAPGAAAILYLFLDFDPAAVPKSVQTEITVQPQGAPDASQIVNFPHPVTIDTASPFLLSPPLRGENWFSPNAPSNFSIHRRVLIVLNGALFLPEEFAVDWVRLNPTGASFKGDPAKNESYLAYRSEVLAAAPGRVVELLDGVPENIPQQPPSIELSVATIGGNFIVLDHGNNRFTFYAHLIPGSLRVKHGDTVAAGQVLALLGNSGNSTEPHLHFHVMDSPSPLASRGLPFILDRFTLKSFTTSCKPPAPGSPEAAAFIPPDFPRCDPLEPTTTLSIGSSRSISREIFLSNSLANF